MSRSGDGARDDDRLLLDNFPTARTGDGARDDGRLAGREPGRAGEGALDEDRLAGFDGGLEDTRDGGNEHLEGPDMEEFLELCLEPSYLSYLPLWIKNVCQLGLNYYYYYMTTIAVFLRNTDTLSSLLEKIRSQPINQ